ncbi:peptide chain release factor 1 [Burkholderia thailandensis]|nr:peptide chain release factor 1 [Burkholderia thailandensis]
MDVACEASRAALVACRLSLVACRLSLVACRLSLVACRLSLVACRLSVQVCVRRRSCANAHRRATRRGLSDTRRARTGRMRRSPGARGMIDHSITA